MAWRAGPTQANLDTPGISYNGRDGVSDLVLDAFQPEAIAASSTLDEVYVFVQTRHETHDRRQVLK